MNDRIRITRGLEQLREVVAILRELANAGPRNQSFKQWRQVTLTLFQRLWPDDPSRAVRFRRIPFSPPTARADAKTTQEYFARGCREALAYLEELVVEFEARDPARNLVRPREWALPTDGEVEEGAAAAPPAEARPEAVRGEPPPEAVRGEETHIVVPPVAYASTPDASPRTGGPLNRPEGSPPRRHLKDMLGFGDDTIGLSPPGSAEPEPPAASEESFARPPEGRDPATSSEGAAPEATEPEAMPPLLEEAEEFHLPGFDPAQGGDPTVTGDAAPTATLWEMLERGIAPRPPVSRAARELLLLAARVDQLGVPPQRRAIVRATLIDLGRQMNSPPVDWAAIRQALSFMMDYPELARQVIPMLVPYLEEAA